MARLTAAVLSLLALLALAESASRARRQVSNQWQPQQQQPQQFQPQPVGGVDFNCPQPDGSFRYPYDCTKYYQCDSGTVSIEDCQPQLAFNENRQFCDWPENVPNCDMSRNQQMFKPEIGNICTFNPYGNGGVFHVAHPQFCNAFFTCATNYLFPLCTFCGSGMVFNENAGGCRAIPAGAISADPYCNGKRFVRPEETSAMSISDSCWPYANLENPWATLNQMFNNGNNNNVPPYNSG